MFEARLTQGDIFKKIIESIKDLVTDCNIDCSEEECAIQCMDSAHVSLVAVRLSAAAFDHYRCDRPNTLGVNTANMAKIFKMMNNDDTLTLKAEDNADSLTMMFEGGKADTIADFGAYACCGIPDGNLHKVLQYILLFYSTSFCSLSK
jgi:proliferating cell nuclear antigen